MINDIIRYKHSIGIDTVEWLDMVQDKHKTEYHVTKLNDKIINDKIWKDNV